MTPVEEILKSDQGLKDLAARIQDDYNRSQASHKLRMERFTEAFRRWRNRVPPPKAGDEEKSNFQVPVIQWHMFGLWARHLQALLGEDAEVVAVPTGPSDYKTVAKVGRFMTWRLFSSMKITQALTVFEFRRLLFGRAHAYTPWRKETYRVIENGAVKERVWYEGPSFEDIWPDDLIVPAEGVDSIQKFTFVIRRLWLTPAELLRREGKGQYFGVRDNWDAIQAAALGQKDNVPDERVQQEADKSQGVSRNPSSILPGFVETWEWYGYGEPDRDGVQAELVSTYLPCIQKCIGLDDLMELYPEQKDRRPFSEGSLVPSGEYWSMGVEEILESIEDEVSANENLFTNAVQFSIGPLVLYKPGSVNMKAVRYEPFTMQPCEDPNGAKIIQPTVNPTGYQVKQQATLAIGERCTGMSDFAMGRSIDRPNAPRTATGQVALLEQGNVRVWLNLAVIREDWSNIISRFWELECQFKDEAGVFFRVTEEDAKGLFSVAQGGSTMTAGEFAGRYDFRLKFATSVWSREAEKERQIQLYGLDLQNPLVVQNPKALWMVTQRAHKALGDPNFSDLLPEPPDLGNPKNPKEEWNMALQGEDLLVNPLDNDDQHLIDHQSRVIAEYQLQPENRDADAINRMAEHMVDHQRQRRAKALVQAQTQVLAQTMAQAVGQLAGGAPPNPAVAPPVLAPQPPMESLSEAQPQ